MKILVVIPARGGSKGIPRKNLRLLNGKPLIYYAINTALNSKYAIDVYVSSEDDEILNTAIQFGAKIHKRDISIADDKVHLIQLFMLVIAMLKRLKIKNMTTLLLCNQLLRYLNQVL